MVDILEEYKKYIPSKPVALKEAIPGISTTEDSSYSTTLLGGDYLSAARARGAQYIRGSADLEKHRLDMFLPTSEGWHAEVCFLEVCSIDYTHFNIACLKYNKLMTLSKVHK